MRLFLATMIIVALLPMFSASLFAEANGPDSSVYGTVPNYQRDLRAVQDDIEFDIESEKEGNLNYAEQLIRDQAILADWRSRCVEVYSTDSAVPDGYSLLKHPGQSETFSLFGACADPVQSPRFCLAANSMPSLASLALRGWYSKTKRPRYLLLNTSA